MPICEHRQKLHGRLRVVRVVCISVFLALAALFWYIQVIKHPIYEYASKNNALRKVTLRAERGLILDRHGEVLVKNRASFKLFLRRDGLKKNKRPSGVVLQAVHQWVPFDEQQVKKRLDALTCQPSHVSALIAEDLTLEELAKIEARSIELPDVDIEEALVRHCTHESLGSHILGYVGEVSQRQLRAKQFKGCSAGDIIGKSGIERQYDCYLRGRAGWKTVVINNRGRVIGAAGTPRPPVRGNDIALTIDFDMMKAAEEAMAGKNGAVVALDPRNGEVYVILSNPSYDPNMFYTRASRKKWREMVDQADHPLFNRVIQAREPPGSVFKIVMAAAGLETGNISPDRRTYCGGGTRIYGQSFACWRQIGHGEMDLYHAVVHSCNVFFYHLGKDIGIQDIARYARKFGLGKLTGIDLPQENPGLVPDAEWKKRKLRETWYKGETISVAIGQGALGVTPLQIANLTAAMANRGNIYKPHLLKKVYGSDRNTLVEPAPELLTRVNLSRSAFAKIRKALWGVVNDDGTGGLSRIEAEEMVIAGKTGTAQVASQRGERKGPKEHAWFTAFAPYGNPEIVVTVLVEHAGHGGEAAAPVARAVFQAYWDKYHGGGEERGTRLAKTLPAQTGEIKR